MFIIIFAAILLAMQYTALLWTVTNTSSLEHGVFTSVLPVAFTVLFMAAVVWTRVGQNGSGAVFVKVMYVWLGVMFIWFCVCTALMLLQVAANAFGYRTPENLGLWAGILSFMLAALSLMTAARAPSLTKIDIENPYSNGNEIKIVQVSDSHLGYGVDPQRFAKLARRINDLEPDIIVFTGDLIEEPNLKPEQYIEILKSLKAPRGKYAVFGNHEYYHGTLKNTDLWVKAGITPVENASVQAGSINIIGVNDIKMTNITKEQFKSIISRSTKPNEFNLLLSHTPLYFKEAADLGVNLMLCGHTHNGQIWPFKYAAKLSFKYVNGLYKYKNSKIYVSSGAFFWGPPMRLFTKNEIVLITLH